MAYPVPHLFAADSPAATLPRHDAADAVSSAPAGMPIRVEWRDSLAWAALRAPWDDLAGRALEPNVFYEPGFAIPAARVFGREIGAVLVWSLQQPIRLLGFFPGRVEPARYGIGLPLFLGWTHPYAPLGTPLVDRDEAATAIAAWLDFLQREPGMPPLALLPFLPEHGAFTQALTTTLAERGGRVAGAGRHQRALLAPADAARAGYIGAGLSKKKRKDLARQRRKLLQRGPVSLRAAATAIELPLALADFMALEARGWKGRAGTAAQQDAATRQFMREALSGLAAAGQARIDRLMVADQPVAAAITLRSRDTAWFWKIAYDETQSAASPGVQLTIDMTHRLLAEDLRQVDSCATADHPMIDRLWRERLTISDRLIAAGPDTRLGFTLALALEHARGVALRLIKGTRNRLGRS
ncbi:MAG TPA: GNAT family N-acetyltransferase [Xanthobacteraceae bacterium]